MVRGQGGKAEARRAWELYQKGIFREIFFEKKNRNAVIVMECRDAEEARDILETLPLVQNGLIQFDLLELEPYPGFARLFER